MATLIQDKVCFLLSQILPPHVRTYLYPKDHRHIHKPRIDQRQVYDHVMSADERDGSGMYSHVLESQADFENQMSCQVDPELVNYLTVIVRPIQYELANLVNDPTIIDAYLRARFSLSLAQQMMSLYLVNRNKEIVLDYLLAHLLRLANVYAEKEMVDDMYTLRLIHLLMAIQDNPDLNELFEIYVPVFPYQGYRALARTLARAAESDERLMSFNELKYHFDREMSIDYLRGLDSIQYCLAHHFMNLSQADQRTILNDLTSRSFRHLNLTSIKDIIYHILQVIVSYSRQIQLSGALTFQTLMLATFQNPNLPTLNRVPIQDYLAECLA